MVSYRLRAVVFDLDDTLYPEAQFVRGGFGAAGEYLAAMGFSGAPQRLEQLYSHSRRKVFDRFAAENGLGKGIVSKLTEIYRGHEPKLEAYADVEQCLRHLAERGIRLGLLTDGVRAVQERKLAALGLSDAFDAKVITEDRRYFKPHIAPFLEVLNRLGTEAGDTAYVGDNPTKDFYITRTLPFVTMRIIREDGVYRGEEYLGGVREKVTLRTLGELRVKRHGCAGAVQPFMYFGKQ